MIVFTKITCIHDLLALNGGVWKGKYNNGLQWNQLFFAPPVFEKCDGSNQNCIQYPHQPTSKMEPYAIIAFVTKMFVSDVGTGTIIFGEN